MRRLVPLVAALAAVAHAQPAPLTVEQIMQRSEAWVGGWPSDVHWTADGGAVYFQWNPQGRYDADSLFRATPAAGVPERADAPDAPRFDPRAPRALSPDGRRWAATRDGDLFVTDRATGATTRLTRTPDAESAPVWLGTDTADGRLAFVRTPPGGAPNLVALDLATAATEQLTDLRSGTAPSRARASAADSLLAARERTLFPTLAARLRRDSLASAARDARRRRAAPPTVWLGTDTAEGLTVDPSGRFVTFRRRAADAAVATQVWAAVTASGRAEAIEARPRVGAPDRPAPLFVTDLARDTTYRVTLTGLPDSAATGGASRVLTAWGPVWRADGTVAVLDVRTRDNRDRWLVALDAAAGTTRTLDHQHDPAWIGGPGIGGWGGAGAVGWLPDGRLWFQTERTGWSHLAALDVATGAVEALTSGEFEVDDAVLLPGGEAWLFGSSEGDTGQWHTWTMPVAEPGRASEAFAARRRLTGATGRWDAALSPDGQHVAFLHSTSNRPPEVYVGRLGESPVRVTDSPTPAWLAAHDWREAEIVHVPASDGAAVPARIFRPEDHGAEPNGAAVLFVHGAGYLQNAHRWWSQYHREWMFHHLLAQRGYVVLDLDYRASAGLGRDWRTAIAGHMGGRDLQDYVDASRWLAETRSIDPERVGIYGGSYGGFITLMALFTEGEHVGAGAALRSVTDWAYYNDPYTRNILGDPAEAPEAYVRSSPVAFAEGLDDPLLMIHGLVDDNVQPQDIFRLTQRLIELGKTDWELALHPVEAHGYTEPSSWTDAYRRILALFERTIGREGAGG